MNTLPQLLLKRFWRPLCAAGLILPAVPVLAAPGQLSDVPLFTTTGVKTNVLLVIDDSGSMDSELLIPSNDGALWWNTTVKTFVGVDNQDGVAEAGRLNFNKPGAANGTWKKYVYLFPNGTGAGNRVYSDDANDHYAVPPLPQYAFARSALYNPAYYDPAVTYKPWPSYPGKTYSNITPTAALSDPEKGGLTFNLTQNVELKDNNQKFRLHSGMTITKGTRYHNGSDWVGPAAADIAIAADQTNGISYFPATYHVLLNSGSYTVKNAAGAVITGDCKTPNPQHFSLFHSQPSDLKVLTGTLNALGPDGQCLKRVEIKPGSTYQGGDLRFDCAGKPTCSYDEEIGNFANWFSYYRKRHLALRGGAVNAFLGLTGLRTGAFTINNRPANVTIWDLETQSNNLINWLYTYSQGSGGTPNRMALDHAGQRFMNQQDIINQACQKNFVIQFTDGYSTLDQPFTTNVDGSEAAPYKDNYGGTLADVAMKYYKTILRTGASLPAGKVLVPAGCDQVPPDPRLDCNRNLHMNTITVGLGTNGTLFGKTHFLVADAYEKPYPVWPDTNTERDPRQIDDLYHAAVNGRGECLSAKTPADLRNKLQDAISLVLSRVGAAAAATFNTTTLTADSTLYLALFNSGNWTGDLLALPIDPITGAVKDEVIWSGADKLDQRNIDADPRTILTYNGTVGVTAQWSNLTDAQRNDLRTAPDGGIDNDEVATARLAFLHGDRSNEGNGHNFRIRGSRLGDIIYSNPVFVKYDDGSAVLYVGANDGMAAWFSGNRLCT